MSVSSFHLKPNYCIQLFSCSYIYLSGLILIYRLPDTVSWFEPPIVCRWETDEEFDEMRRIDEEEQKMKKKTGTNIKIYNSRINS